MNKKKVVLGILAHVDAGKTTLSESLLYLTGAIRKPGRVDHQNAYLDTEELERARGITIFSKQALFSLGDLEVTLLDTPGHVDFSAEMERVLQVLDYGILVINGADGIQGHTLTLWKLLQRYQIPVFLFVNKMDQEGTNRSGLLKELAARLDDRCLDFGRQQEEDDFLESIAMCEEQAMESYLETGRIEEGEIARLIRCRKVFPCYFGSALKLEGVEDLLRGMEQYIRVSRYPGEFGARVFKITRDKQGNRLTHMKITGGSLRVKEVLLLREIPLEEKVNQIRIYSGDRFEILPEALAGTVCAVTGLERTYAGQGLGSETGFHAPILEPVLTCQILLPEECDVHGMLRSLRQLEEEEPHLHIVWKEQSGEIHAQVMGEVEMEILRAMVRNRFETEIDFGPGSLVYKETILEPVEGVGHFEPLRHYAEVHLLLEPLETGSGLKFNSLCSEDMLGRNWQRLVLTHLEEKKHKGVLTGSEITDMKITLTAGRAHPKHTEGGDFRQATYRAVRQGLRKAKSVLLEPVYEFRLEIPSGMVGRALSDIQKMQGRVQVHETDGETAVITGCAPVATMRDYQMEVTAYSRGLGKLYRTLKGYEPCHNESEIIAACEYDPEGDLENPTGSVFCAHGAGFPVNWDRVEEYQHVDSGIRSGKEHDENSVFMQEESLKAKRNGLPGNHGRKAFQGKDFFKEDKELEEIFTRTYGPVERYRNPFKKTISPVRQEHGEKDEGHKAEGYKAGKRDKQGTEKYLLVDGYNIIFAWEELKILAERSLDAARSKLMDILCNYQGFREDKVILVFDAYRVKGNLGETQKYHNIHVVYTKEAETADQYIERVVHEIGRKYDVVVATSDAMEQMIIWGDGARRISARGLREEIERMEAEIRQEYLEQTGMEKNYPLREASLE